MRVSDSLQYRTVLLQLTGVQRNLHQATKEASSGQRLDRPSVDPVGAARLVRIQSALDATSSYRGVIATARADLELAESTLASATELLTRASELAMHGANGATTDEARQHIAEEVRQIREQLLALANKKGTQGHLFAGTATDTVPFDASGGFFGNDQERVAQVGANDTAVVNVSGAEAFTAAAGGRDVFADLADLESALLANNLSDIAAGVNNSDTCRRQILAARVDAGLRVDRLQTADAVHEQSLLALSSEKSDVVDADAVEAYSRFVSLQQGLDQAIAVSRTILSTLGKGRFH